MIDKVIIKTNDEAKIHIDGVSYDIDNVISAIKKQTQQKPIVKQDIFGDFALVCPSCERPITNVWSKQNYKPKYCHYCGQNLDCGE